MTISLFAKSVKKLSFMRKPLFFFLAAQHERSWDSKVALVVRNPPAKAGDTRDMGSIPGLERSPGEGILATPVFLSGKSHGQRSLAGYSPWGHRESNTTEHATTCGVLVPGNPHPCPLQWKYGVLTTGLPGKSHFHKKTLILVLKRKQEGWLLNTALALELVF